jgi:hypothetical protein
MPTFWESLKLHLKLVAGTWWQLAIGGVAAVVGVVTDIRTDLEVPALAWVGAAVSVLLVAQFASFRRLHIQLSHQLAEAEDQLADFEAESNMPYTLAMKPLSSSFDFHTFSHPLESSRRGLAVRCVIGTIWDGHQLEVDSETKIALRDALGSSMLEDWLSSYFEIPIARSWRLTNPTGEWVATVARGPTDVSVRGIELDAQAIREVPFPRSRRGWVATVVDLSIRIVEDEVVPVWDLAGFCKFCDILIKGTADLHTSSPAILGEESVDIVGPVLALAAHGHLDEFIRYPDWERAAGAGRSSFLTMDAHTEDKATNEEVRRMFIASELRSLLSREGFIAFEDDVETLLVE